jgi:NAD(P)-dependent dehydrogenase (short-subunit alcohol dehydrogenase family)
MNPRVALVTGGSRGIGAAVAARLAVQGWRVLAVARRAPERLEAGIAFRSCDVADGTAARALIGELDRLDALVNAAGIAGANPIDASDDALWHDIIAANLHGTYHCCSAAQSRLPDGTGRIVNMASVLGLRGVADQTAYCAAKHAVVGYTRALALALAPRGITVNAVCPGWTDTAMASARFAEIGITRAQAEAGMPTGHMVSPAEVAETVSFLLSPAAASITGHALPLDGGSLAAP